MSTQEATLTEHTAAVARSAQADALPGPRASKHSDSAARASRWPAADPGVIATTRRLAWALTGVPDALSPISLAQTLRERAGTARKVGLAEAAAAFEAAEHYVARALDAHWPPSAGAEAAWPGPGRQQLYAAAVRQVFRAYGLSGDSPVAGLRAPASPPDPELIEQPSALIDDLCALRDWSGLSTAAFVLGAQRAGVPVTERQLLATLEGRRFPTPGVVEAIARGSGLPDAQCFAWLAARHRAARVFLSARAGEPRLAHASAAALDPRDAETPAQLSALLTELKARRGLSLSQIQLTARGAGHPVSWSRLSAVVARSTFPTPRTLEAFVSGCGIDPVEREAWLLARERIVAGRRRTRQVTRRPVSAPAFRPGGPPDPRAVRTWAQFAAALEGLVRWAGVDLATIAHRALDRGIPVTTDALRYTLAHRTLPAEATLQAFTIGCGLSTREQFDWRAVRGRLAMLPESTQVMPPRAARPVVGARSLARSVSRPLGTLGSDDSAAWSGAA